MDFIIEDLHVEEVVWRVAGERDAIELEVCARPGVGCVRHLGFNAGRGLLPTCLSIWSSFHCRRPCRFARVYDHPCRTEQTLDKIDAGTLRRS
jgi:hypothetical protein